MRKLFFLMPLTMYWSACKTDDSILPPNVVDPPYFSVTYFPDSTQREVVAGLENTYLFTDYSTGSDDVVTCTGIFSDVQCLTDTCPGTLRFEFRNKQLGSVVLTDSAFHLGLYAFSSDDPPTNVKAYHTVFQVSGDTSQGYTDFHWIFNNLTSADGSNIAIDLPIDPPSVRVALRAHSDNGYVSSVVRTVSLEAPGELYPNADIWIFPMDSNYRLQLLHSGPFADFSWSTGAAQPVFTVGALEKAYSVTINDNGGNTAYAGLDSLPNKTNSDLITANFSAYSVLVDLTGDPLQRGTVAIQWTDASGQVWRSGRGPQESNASFQVLESKLYELNELGQKTWQMQVSFVCRLYGDHGDSIPFSGTGRIAVAYP